MQKKFKVGLVCFLAILALTCMGYFSYGWYASFQKLTGTEFGVANEWWHQVVTKDSNGKINGSEISAIVTAFLYMPVQTFIGAVVLIVALLNYRELGRQIESNEKSQKITEILEMISILDEKLSSDIKNLEDEIIKGNDEEGGKNFSKLHSFYIYIYAKKFARKSF